MTKTMIADIKNLATDELKKLLVENQNQKGTLGIKLRAQQSHDQKTYHMSKKSIAQLKTELKARELTNESN